MNYIKIINDVKLNIVITEVLRYQGYKLNKENRIPPNIMQIVEEEIEHGYELLTPQGIYRLLEINKFISPEEIELKDGYILKFPQKMTRLLQFAHHLLVGVVTIGDLLEKEVSTLISHKDFPRALALDAVGTVAVEDLSRKIRELASQEIKKYGFGTGKHFSPGYDGWDITQQKVIFDLIPTSNIGVILTEGCMMIPRKSLSWLIGAGPRQGEERLNSSNDESYYNCKHCQLKSCQFRWNNHQNKLP